MSFNNKGFDQVKKRLNDITKGVQPSTLNSWADTILRSAQTRCHDIGGRRIHLERKSSTEFDVKFLVEDSEALECLISATESHLTSMPEITRAMFERYLEGFKAQRRKFR